MKTIYTTLLGVLLILPACNRNDGERVRASGSEPTTTETMKEQRDQYVRSVDAKLDEFDKKFDGLGERAASMAQPARDNFKKQIDSLRDSRRAVADKLDDLKKVSVESWTTMKGPVDTALANLERSYERVSASNENVPATTPKSGKSY
jgi:hypothetical protein